MKATTKKERMYQRIQQHGENLLRIFPDATEQDPIKLCKKLRRLESKGNQLALRLCNEPMDYDEADRIADDILWRVDRILNCHTVNIHVFLNRDPRGYALKIRDSVMRAVNLPLHCDWGGYGIIAPEFDGER